LKRIIISFIGLTLGLGLLCSCASTADPAALKEIFPAPEQEASWVIDGKPAEFEGESWYPQDNIDVLLDSEVVLVGEYQGVQLFVEKLDVRPYERLYTKVGKHKFRIFTKGKKEDPKNDKSK